MARVLGDVMLLRSLLGLAVVFSNLPPVVPEAGEPPAMQSAVQAMPLPGHELVAKVQEFCLSQPRDCMEIAQAVSKTAIRAATPPAPLAVAAGASGRVPAAANAAETAAVRPASRTH